MVLGQDPLLPSWTPGKERPASSDAWSPTELEGVGGVGRADQGSFRMLPGFQVTPAERRACPPLEE